jgi:CRP/FNR family cyclic AMP-dependent transcriptional regulator
MTNLLENLSSSEIQALMRAGERRICKPGDLLIEQQSTAGIFGIVLSGALNVIRFNLGRRLVLATLTKGEAFGELSLILGIPHTATVEAKTKCDVLILSPKTFAAFAQTNRGLERALLKLLAQRLVDTSKRATDFAILDVTGRVLAYLREHAENEAGLLRCEISNQRRLAEELGTSREMVTRALKLLEE